MAELLKIFQKIAQNLIENNCYIIYTACKKKNKSLKNKIGVLSNNKAFTLEMKDMRLKMYYFMIHVQYKKKMNKKFVEFVYKIKHALLKWSISSVYYWIEDM